MVERRKILELFEEQKDFMEDRINHGIEVYRKGYARLEIKDKNGEPISNAKVCVKQKDHEFKFGANLFMLDELETEEKNNKYKQYFKELFNMATLPFYWNATEPERGKTRYDRDSEKLYRRPAIDLCMEYCEENGIEPREHALAYEAFFPDWLPKGSIHGVKRELERRYKEIAERYKDRIPTIEVTNEMMWQNRETAFYKEPNYVEWCFKTAEKYFTSNELAINECDMWEGACLPTDRYYSNIETNLLKGARIDAIGLQYHIFSKKENEYDDTRRRYNPEHLYNVMDLYAKLGKPLQITEITIPAYSEDEEDEMLQAELLEKLYSIWFSHPNMEQIIYWNLVDGYAHAAEPGDMNAGENYFRGGLLRFDMTPKPAYYAIKNLIQNKWHTEEDVVTNDKGIAQFKGFYGKYDVEIEVGGKVINKEINLSAKGKKEFEIEV